MAIILICFFLPFLSPSLSHSLFTTTIYIYIYAYPTLIYMYALLRGRTPRMRKNKIRSVCFRGIGCTKFSLALYFLLLLLFLFKNAISSFYLLILFRCPHPSRPKQYKNPFKSLDYNKRYIDFTPDTESRLCIIIIIIIIIIYTVQGPAPRRELYPCGFRAGSVHWRVAQEVRMRRKTLYMPSTRTRIWSKFFRVHVMPLFRNTLAERNHLKARETHFSPLYYFPYIIHLFYFILLPLFSHVHLEISSLVGNRRLWHRCDSMINGRTAKIIIQDDK